MQLKDLVGKTISGIEYDHATNELAIMFQGEAGEEKVVISQNTVIVFEPPNHTEFLREKVLI